MGRCRRGGAGGGSSDAGSPEGPHEPWDQGQMGRNNLNRREGAKEGGVRVAGASPVGPAMRAHRRVLTNRRAGPEREGWGWGGERGRGRERERE